MRWCDCLAGAKRRQIRSKDISVSRTSFEENAFGVVFTKAIVILAMAHCLKTLDPVPSHLLTRNFLFEMY